MLLVLRAAPQIAHIYTTGNCAIHTLIHAVVQAFETFETFETFSPTAPHRTARREVAVITVIEGRESRPGASKHGDAVAVLTAAAAAS